MIGLNRVKGGNITHSGRPGLLGGVFAPPPPPPKTHKRATKAAHRPVGPFRILSRYEQLRVDHAIQTF